MVYGQALQGSTEKGNAVVNGAVMPSVSDPADTGAVMQSAGNMQENAIAENATEPPDNDLIDFDAF